MWCDCIDGSSPISTDGEDLFLQMENVNIANYINKLKTETNLSKLLTSVAGNWE